MIISHFLHAALLVSDLHRSSQFYGTILGLSVVDRPLDFPGIWYQIGTIQLHLMVDE
ncbi:MAG: VOC family protein, partial [Prochlorotrichaceae cyanobacterium]